VVEYRRHTSRWDVVKYAAVAVLPTGIAAWNAFRVTQGLTTGAVMSLRRRSYDFVSFDAEPSWFLFNVCLRTLAVVFFGTIAVLLWKQLGRDVRI
jgi:hypothetical protein